VPSRIFEEKYRKRSIEKEIAGRFSRKDAENSIPASRIAPLYFDEFF